MHHPKMAGYLIGNRLYQLLNQTFFWTTMPMNCYVTVWSCVGCAPIRIIIRKIVKGMHPSPTKAPPEFKEIEILIQVLLTEWRNLFLKVITDSSSDSNKKRFFTAISVGTIAIVIVDSWILTHISPKWKLSDYVSQFKSEFFQHVRRILGESNQLIRRYHFYCVWQLVRFTRSFTNWIHHYVAQYPMRMKPLHWDPHIRAYYADQSRGRMHFIWAQVV